MELAAKRDAKAPRITVSAAPNRDGLVELGPMSDAFGLGDTLMVTPCAKALGTRAVMLLPERMKDLGPLFDGLCPWRISETYPVFPWCTMGPVVESNMAILRLPARGALPYVEITALEYLAAKKLLKDYRNPIAFIPTCAARWRKERGATPEFLAPITTELAKRWTVLQFGFQDFPLLPGTIRMPWLGVRMLAHLYHAIGRYVGVNTGDYHLMTAVGGCSLVLDPPADTKVYNPNMWRYRSNLTRYVSLRDRAQVLANLNFLG